MWFKWVLIGLMVVEVMGYIASIGVPAKAKTSGDAIAALLINGLLIAGILHYWGAN